MQVTSVGHAGFHIQTGAGSILCDPWVNPAYFASWFPFPDNTGLNWAALGDCDYLYISHLHKDHFDPRTLRDHVNKDATVLLPDYPVPDLQRELEALGFHTFFCTEDSVKHGITGPKGHLSIMIIALRAPADGPLGDSALVVTDGTTTAFNMNDARPVDLGVVTEEFGPVDVHMLQYSGAIWFPWVYRMIERTKRAFGEQKRQRQMDRARSFIDQVGAAHVIPSAGPPVFLDDDLRYLNDDQGDPANIFPDQTVFLSELEKHGNTGGILMIPGSTAEFDHDSVTVTHPIPYSQVEKIFSEKASYIEDMATRMAPVIEKEKAAWAPAAGAPLLEPLRAKFEPIMARSAQISDGIGYPVALQLTEDGEIVETVVLDFPERIVRPRKHVERRFRYGFTIDRALVRTALRDDEPDWVNSIFLSIRFTAFRIGGYNEYLYTFFKCLTPERIDYADGWFAEGADDDTTIEIDGWQMQRRCPHLKADLSQTGSVDGTTLTCSQHGWQWDLESGRCLTARGHELRCRRTHEEAGQVAEAAAED